MTSRNILLISSLTCAIAASCKIMSSDAGSQVKESFDTSDALILDGLPPEMRETTWNRLPRQTMLNIAQFDTAYYWPMANGGVTARLFGESLSPLEKFELVFGPELSVTETDPDAADRMQQRGITRSYLQSIDGDRKTTWAGHCEGTALAVQWFKPAHSVSLKSGDGQSVTFYPHEIRALLAYWLKGYAVPGGQFKFSGNRVQPVTSKASRDDRPEDRAVRDINPGIFMIALGNVMARASQPLIADISPFEEVLNFPVVGYRVIHEKTLPDQERERWARNNPRAQSFVQTKTEVIYLDNHRVIVPTPDTSKTFSKTYEFVLELDQDGKIIGGEWSGVSQQDHPDFMYYEARDDRSLDDISMNGFHLAPAMKRLVEESMTGSVSPAESSQMNRFIKHPDNNLGYRAFENHPLFRPEK